MDERTTEDDELYADWHVDYAGRVIEGYGDYEDDDRYMGSDSDFSDHALGIDY